MAKKLPLAKGAAALASGAGITILVLSVVRAQQVVEPPPADFVAPVVEDTAALRGPRQPVFYRHDVHAGQYQMDCRYCHFAAEVSSSPGLPTVSTCMGCHSVAGAGTPEVQKVQQADANGTPIEWVEVHTLPPFVHFPHMRHVNADPPVTCQECHGPVQEMVQVYDYSPMKMGWCLDCHNERNVTTDCTACHY